MIKYSLGSPPFTRHVTWFSEHVSLSSCLVFSIYRQCRYFTKSFLFKIVPFHTIHIDLLLKEDTIFNGFSKNTRYEVRRSDKDGVNHRVVENIDEFIEFYAAFASSKKRALISQDDLTCYGEHLIITAAVHNGVDLVMHSYLVDKKASIVRLLHSASNFRSTTTHEFRQIIGRANRYLHWMDILRFKTEGFFVYDFGGYALHNVDDDLVKVNEFKRGFGGTVVEQYEYTSFPLVIMLGIRKFFVEPRS